MKPWTALNKVKYLNNKIVTVIDPCEIQKDDLISKFLKFFVPLTITIKSLDSRLLMTPANFMDESVRSLKLKLTSEATILVDDPRLPSTLTYWGLKLGVISNFKIFWSENSIWSRTALFRTFLNRGIIYPLKFRSAFPFPFLNLAPN